MNLTKNLSSICGGRRVGRLVFFILVVYMLAPSISWSAPADFQPALTKFFLKAFTPVVGEKRTNMKYKVFAQGEQLLLVIEGQHQGIPLSRYIIRFGSEATTFTIPKLQMVTKQLPNHKPYAQLTGELTLSAEKVIASSDLKEEKNLVRLLLRADPLLLPQLNAPGLPTPTKVSLTDPQQELLVEVQESIKKQRAEGKSPRALIYLPTGIGKTVLAALATKTQGDTSQQIFFVVENKEVLRDATDKFIQLLGISREDTAILTGDYDGNKIAALKNKKVVSITRTGLFNALDRFAEHLDQRHTPATFIFDEAQHLGRKDGQFDKIIAAIEQHIKTQDLILGLSATPWHLETDFVRRFFSPFIFSMFLTSEEREQVLQNKDLVQLSMTMVLRAMSLGYINPIFAFDEITTVPGLKDTSVRDLLKRDEMTLSKMTTDEAVEHLTKQISVHQPLLLKMLHEIIASVDRSEEHTYYWNRGLIFVPSIAHANVYAYMLNRLRKANPAVRMEFEAYHSKLDSDEANKVMDWFKDEQVRGFKHQHKYLIVVRSAGEGFDFPAINHLITAKPYNKEDQIGVRELLQNLGRATRLAPFKTQLRVTDFTGDMRRLFAELDPNLIRPFPALESTLKTPSPIFETEVVITRDAPRVEDLMTENVDVADLVTTPRTSKKSEAKQNDAETLAQPIRPPPMIVPDDIHAELKNFGARSPFEFMVRNLSKFKFEGYLEDEKRLEHLQSQLPPDLASFFLSYIRSVSGARENNYVYTWNVYFQQMEALAQLRYPGSRYTYLFQTPQALSDSVFDQLVSPFDRQQFINNVKFNTFLSALKSAESNYQRGMTYLKQYISRILFIPNLHLSHVEQLEKYFEDEVLSVFNKSSFSKIDLIHLPLQDWPERWRSEMRRLTREPGVLTQRAQTAANLAGIGNLNDFLIQYYNENFANNITPIYEQLVENNSPLLSFHSMKRMGILGEEVKATHSFLTYGMGTKNLAAIFISLDILVKNVNAGKKIDTEEFASIYFLVTELISRSRMLGIDSYLTSAQVEKLRQMTSNGCELILAPKKPVVKKEKVRRRKFEPDIRHNRFI